MVFRHECPQKEPLLAAERPITLAPDAVGPDRGGSHLGCSPYGCLEPTGRRWWEFRIKGGRWQTILWHTAERYHPRQGWRPGHDLPLRGLPVSRLWPVQPQDVFRGG